MAEAENKQFSALEIVSDRSIDWIRTFSTALNRVITFLAFVTVTLGIFTGTSSAQTNSAAYRSARPKMLTLDEKIQAADLIVLGTATEFGPATMVITNDLCVVYDRGVRVEPKAVLWPTGVSNKSEIIFHSTFVTNGPGPWCVYTNTPGVFFLVRTNDSAQEQWQCLGNESDWMEAPTNALAVLLSITKQRGKVPSTSQLQVPQFVWPEPTRFDQNVPLRLALPRGVS